MPVVSVILNSYNQSRFVREAMESVLCQTYADLELIVVDNGSTDNSQGILRQYAGDSRVRLLLHGENEPVSRRFNEAVAVARGQFVSFLYSDDFYLPQKLERQLEVFGRLAPDYGVVYGPVYRQNEVTGHRWITARIDATGDLFTDMMLRSRAYIDMITPLTRLECLLENRFDEALFAEGEIIFSHIALTHKFGYCREPLAVSRDHGGNAGKAMKRNRDMTLASLRRLRAHPAVDAERAVLIDRCEAAMLRTYAWQAARLSPDMDWARECLAMAFAVRRRAALHPKFLGTMLLSVMPAEARRRVNHLGHLLRGDPGNAVYVDEYEGLEAAGRK